LDHLGALEVRQVPGLFSFVRLSLRRVLEAPEQVALGPLRRVDDRLECDGGEASVAGDQRVQVERIREDPLLERREIVLVSRPLLEQVLDDQLVPLAPRGAGVQQAPPEMVAELVVVDQVGVVGMEERLDRVVDVETGQLRAQARRQRRPQRSNPTAISSRIGTCPPSAPAWPLLIESFSPQRVSILGGRGLAR
jgi:hypothetical protein